METTENLKQSTGSPLADAWAELQAHADRGEPLEPAAYRLAFADPEFLLRRETRGVRFQLELLKPDLALTEAGIDHTIVVYGSARFVDAEQAAEQLAQARAGGNAQGIALAERAVRNAQRYEQARKSVDFIQRYIFPGGALPSVNKMLQVISTETDLNLHHMEDFGLHYARTLRLWHDNLRQARHRLEQIGYDDYFYRLWEFYLCYCEGGFLERSIGTAQLLLAKPGARPAPLLGHFGA